MKIWASQFGMFSPYLLSLVVSFEYYSSDKVHPVANNENKNNISFN